MLDPLRRDDEWLEADGLGGFASGTVGGARTRRYHALLLAATTPPTGRVVLVNGFDAWVETDAGRFALSTQRYVPGVEHPDGATRIASFDSEPWPLWRFGLPGGVRVEQEIIAQHGTGVVAVAWRLVGGAAPTRTRDGDARDASAGAGAGGGRTDGAPAGAGSPAVLTVRVFLSGRDYHAMHHENGAFNFDADVSGERVAWRPYAGLPRVVATTNGTYAHEPLWYHNFLYGHERERGLDDTEDLASPGTFRWDLRSSDAVLLLSAESSSARGSAPASGAEPATPIDDAAPARDPATAAAAFAGLRMGERARRARFATPLERAADAYLVRRGAGKTIVAGYPWFTDWGRDTFIALRGLCIAAGRLDDARDILLEWSGAVSEGMLPNRFPDAGGEPEFNSVDASLWYVIAVHDLLRAMDANRRKLAPPAAERLRAAVRAILDGYARGTRFGIRLDDDGLLAAGEPGWQLTWMDAKVGDRVITPRIGKPVEIQALWLNALRFGESFAGIDAALFERGLRAFQERFWNEERGCLYDVVDGDHRRGAVDGSLRPNQIFAVGGLPLTLLDAPRARRVVDAVEAHLWTPVGLRSLAPGEPGYAPRYTGGPAERDGVYHQGTVWPWLSGAFVEAWLRVRGGAAGARREARERFLAPLLAHLDHAGLGHVSEIFDAEPPHTPRGCPFQAWSVGELLRIKERLQEVPFRRPDATTRTRGG